MALEEGNASNWKWDNIARNITKVILPDVAKVADFLNDMGKNIAPIGYSQSDLWLKWKEEADRNSQYNQWLEECRYAIVRVLYNHVKSD